MSFVRPYPVEFLEKIIEVPVALVTLVGIGLGVLHSSFLATSSTTLYFIHPSFIELNAILS